MKPSTIENRLKITYIRPIQETGFKPIDYMDIRKENIPCLIKLTYNTICPRYSLTHTNTHKAPILSSNINSNINIKDYMEVTAIKRAKVLRRISEDRKK